MSKLNIFTKKPFTGKNIGMAVSTALVGGASAVGTSALINLEVIQKDKTGQPRKIGKYAGVAAIGLGILGNVFVEEPHIRQAMHGMVAAGSIHATGNLIVPEHKAKLGLGDVGAPASSNEDTYAEMIRKSLKAAEESKTEYRTAGADESVNGLGTVSDDPMMAIV
jgi:hypothetical protein